MSTVNKFWTNFFQIVTGVLNNARDVSGLVLSRTSCCLYPFFSSFLPSFIRSFFLSASFLLSVCLLLFYFTLYGFFSCFFISFILSHLLFLSCYLSFFFNFSPQYYTLSHVTRNPPTSMRRLFHVVTNWSPAALVACFRGGSALCWPAVYTLIKDKPWPLENSLAEDQTMRVVD
jgi:hypothetical protein